MNKSKIIFIIAAGIVLVLTLLLVITLRNGGEPVKENTQKGAFTIWLYADKTDGMLNVLEDFRALNADLEKQQFNVVSFSSFEEYNLALAAAMSKGTMPDLFMLSGNEKTSVFQDQILGIPSNIISPNDFRKKYKGIFADDMLVSYQDGDEKREALQGVPVGYETLGVYYNRRYVRISDLNNISTLNNKIRDLKKTKPGVIPIAMGNGSTVRQSFDILTQLFLLEEGVSGIGNLAGNTAKQALTTYFLYGDVSGDNAYDSKFAELSASGKDNYNLFSQGDTYMVVGYPRDLLKIKENGYSKNFLLANPFPHYFSGAGKTFANYSYFVISKDTQQLDLSYKVLQYLSSDRGAETYLDAYPYYLPALLSLESDKLEERIDEEYNINLGDFYDPNFDVVSFDKGIKSIYDREVQALLDNSTNYISEFATFISKIQCQSSKLADFSNISNKCE